MKLQLTDAVLRIRIDEAELAALLAGDTLRMAPRAGGRPLFAFELAVGEAGSRAAPGAAWQVGIGRERLEGYAATLPRRDALVLEEGGDGAPRVDFEVDVRDSIAARGPRRRPDG